MTVSTSFRTQNGATSHISDDSHPHGASPSVQAQSTSSSSSTLHPSHSTPHVTSTNPLIARPIAPTDVSHPHVTSHLEQAYGSSTSSSTSLLLHPTATSSWVHGASHEPHPCIAPCSVRSRASSPLSPTLHTSHSNSPSTSAPRKKRSRRCFVCGGTGKHRLNPRFCPRTYELLSKHLATFDATFRLVSFDGSPLPMTRHPGGVAAHLLSPRRFPPRTLRVVPRSVSKSPGTSQAKPPHVHRAPHASPIPVPRSIPNAVPASNSNPPHAPPAAVEHPRCVSTPDHSFESNPPHLPPFERLPSPPFYLPVPIPNSHPHSETPSNSTPRLDNAFILQIFDCLILSLSWRRTVAELIDAIDRLTVDADITVLQKRVRERYKISIPPI
ncbi:hypothetical protein B0H14DRAFT_3777638 [Mycena olivaceomarginata]|nr:hypothetical protein B0H14DRAFT_3777638 [Mycena olivaceomarginata]